MDILFKLRLLFWLMVLTLWGTMVYQFLGGELGERPSQMQWLANPFPKRPPISRIAPQPAAGRGAAPVSSPAPTGNVLAAFPAETETPHSLPSAEQLPGPRIGLPGPGAGLPGVGRRPATTIPPRHYPPTSEQPAPIPTGFYKSVTTHFIVYSEKEAADQNLLDTLETLHGNLMLDLAAFSPWARDERISIYLFRSQENYRRVTGRPSWSGGASSISKRKIYLYGSDEQIGILAHELCHIYFDGFFDAGHPDPLWLSEGMATLMQIERGLSSPDWLPENLNILYQGGGYRLANLMKVDSTSNADDDRVRLWYTESYSIVRFLIRSKWESSFYRFCLRLRNGTPIDKALKAAYGMPFDRVQALEYAWRYDLQTRRIRGLRGLR